MEIYLYGVIEETQEKSFGKIGIKDHEVYSIGNNEFQGIVQDVNGDFKELKDLKILEELLLKHEEVLRKIQEECGGILPASFGTILKGEKELKNWLIENGENLKQKLEKVKAKNEYAIKIFWDMKLAGENILKEDEELKNLEAEIKLQMVGKAYLYRQKLEKILREKIEEKCNQLFKNFYTQISQVVSEVKLEKTSAAKENKSVLMNLSVLADLKESKDLGEVLEKINQKEEFEVSFAGPFAPYSFV